MTITKQDWTDRTYIVKETNRRELRATWIANNRNPTHIANSCGDYIGTIFADGEYVTANIADVDNHHIAMQLANAAYNRREAMRLRYNPQMRCIAIKSAQRALNNARELRLHLASL